MAVWGHWFRYRHRLYVQLFVSVSDHKTSAGRKGRDQKPSISLQQGSDVTQVRIAAAVLKPSWIRTQWTFLVRHACKVLQLHMHALACYDRYRKHTLNLDICMSTTCQRSIFLKFDLMVTSALKPCKLAVNHRLLFPKIAWCPCLERSH